MKLVRRIVIGRAQDNQSHIFSDEPVMNTDHFITGVPEAVSINLWATDRCPPILNPQLDPTRNSVPFLPATNGTIFRICDIPPDTSFINKLDDILLNDKKLSEDQKRVKHPIMHQASTLTYALVLEVQLL